MAKRFTETIKLFGKPGVQNPPARACGHVDLHVGFRCIVRPGAKER